jgi:hypothetical protein
MLIKEKKVRTVTLDDADLKQAIIMYLKERGERNIDETNINIDPKKVTATVTITEELEPTNK